MWIMHVFPLSHIFATNNQTLDSKRCIRMGAGKLDPKARHNRGRGQFRNFYLRLGWKANGGDARMQVC